MGVVKRVRPALRGLDGEMGIMTEKRHPRNAQHADLRATTDDLDRRLEEAIMRLERVRSKALNAVESMLATR